MMKRKIILLVASFILCSTCYADTIDVWQVYYNGKKIFDFNDYTRQDVILDSDSIKDGDSLTVSYFRDTPCHDCLTFLIVEDEKRNPVSLGKGKGTFNPITISLRELVAYIKLNHNKHFEIFYDETGDNRSKVLFLFRLRIE